MHIHILGICGTFMGGVARLAVAAGHRVTGSDRDVYPPMSDQLAELGIEVSDPDDLGALRAGPDLVIVGNARSRGDAEVEHTLASGLPYTSGPAWLAEQLLRGQHVVAIAGTHGKTTTASMVVHLLEAVGMEPGYLIGGVPLGREGTARAGAGDVFVIEADEYDSAFFDKRAKFVHYGPRSCVLNNLEFDHADIYPDLDAISRQFHHLVRTVPGDGRLIVNAASPALEAVLAQGAWTPVRRYSCEGGADLSAQPTDTAWKGFELQVDGEVAGLLSWEHGLIGRHNAENALAALAVAEHLGVPPAAALAALASFPGVKRRLELRGEVGGVRVYDDFAHHPSAVRSTLEGMAAAEEGRLIAVLEPRSSTMRAGHHADQLAAALAPAQRALLLQPEALGWDLGVAVAAHAAASTHRDVAAILTQLCDEARPGDRVVIMSNGGFGGIHERLLAALEERGG